MFENLNFCHMLKWPFFIMKRISQVVFLSIFMCCVLKKEKGDFFSDENVFVLVTIFVLT